MPDADAFLDKARESLASAEDDFESGRYNACARNAYYAAFSSSHRCAFGGGIRPTDKWEHRFVISRFSGVLVRRRKLYPAKYSSFLAEALALRSRADYTESETGRRRAPHILEGARDIVRVTEEISHGNRQTRQ